MPLPDSNISSISVSRNPEDKNSPVGAGASQINTDHFFYHHLLLKWIQETKQKLPFATPLLRKESFLADPLLKGTIYPYLKNVLLQGFTIQTKDNKLYEAAITEITDYLEQLQLMQVFREDFLDLAILTGHSYRRMDPGINQELVNLEKIEPSTVEIFTDPWYSSIVAYHQKASINTSWSAMGTTEQVDSWFIPFQNNQTPLQIEDIYKTFVSGRGVGNDLRVFDLFETLKLKYDITDISNLRITSSERIIPMHHSENLNVRNYHDDNYFEKYSSAPIDSVILAIWLKRLLLVNAPNLIFIVLSPFLHLKSGVLKESKDMSGNPVLISSLPQKPSTYMQTSNPEQYSAMLANFNNWIDDLKKGMKNLMECVKNGGVYSSGPDQEIKPVESSRTINYQFIKGLIDLNNEEIGLNFGFPMSLVLATGTELASSRNILQIFNTVHAGERTEYEAVADKIIKKVFAGRTWQGTTTENEEEIRVTYSFEEIRAHFVLDVPDTKDKLTEAQADNTNADTLVKLKGAGAGKEDLQALAEERGYGLLALDGQASMVQDTEAPTKEQTEQVNAILKSVLAEVLFEQGMLSTNPTDPSGFKDLKITKQLQETYKTAQETMDQLFEEH
jgi:hypothetical protein